MRPLPTLVHPTFLDQQLRIGMAAWVTELQVREPSGRIASDADFGAPAAKSHLRLMQILRLMHL